MNRLAYSPFPDPGVSGLAGRFIERRAVFLEFPATTVDWCALKLSPLLCMRNAPKERANREAFAAAVLRIAHPELVELRIQSPRRALADEVIIAALAIPPTLLEAVRIQRDGIGLVNPLNWLIASFVDTARFCPVPIEMRCFFVEKFPCADGLDDLGKEDKD